MASQCTVATTIDQQSDEVTDLKVLMSLPIVAENEALMRTKRQGLASRNCLSGPNHFARHSERGKKTRQREKEVGRQRQGMDRPGVRQVPEDSREQRKMEETGCEVICGAPTTPVVKGKVKVKITPNYPLTSAKVYVSLLYRYTDPEHQQRYVC